MQREREVRGQRPNSGEGRFTKEREVNDWKRGSWRVWNGTGVFSGYLPSDGGFDGVGGRLSFYGG